MITLLNQSDKKYEMRMTNNPVTNPRQSPRPEGFSLEELDPKDPSYQIKKMRIENHPNYSESEVIYLKPGLNKFENEEHAEYFYAQLGNPESGGSIPSGVGQTVPVTNSNFVWETDKEGNPTKGPLFNKYRKTTSAQVRTTALPSQFDLRPETA